MTALILMVLRRTFLVSLILCAGCGKTIHEKWTVEPAPRWQWRSCLTTYETDAITKGCGSPMPYDEALWWSETKGGRTMGCKTFMDKACIPFPKEVP